MKPFRHRTFSSCSNCVTISMPAPSLLPGASVAFTTLVMRKLPEARKGKADAERAYPEWVPMARALSRAMMLMLCLAVIITLSIAALAAYIYLGNAKVANLTDIKAQFKLLDEEILREG